jgi:hypothetical protein
LSKQWQSCCFEREDAEVQVNIHLRELRAHAVITLRTCEKIEIDHRYHSSDRNSHADSYPGVLFELTVTRGGLGAYIPIGNMSVEGRVRRKEKRQRKFVVD